MSQTIGDAKEAESSVPFPSIQDETPKPQDKRKPSGHKRSISGNLFSRLNILKVTDGEKSDNDQDDRNAGSPGRNAMSETLSNKSNRKRKGSLRKAVLAKGRERKGSEKSSPLASPQTIAIATTPPTLDSPEEFDTPRASQDIQDENEMTPMPEVPPRWPFRTLSKVSIPSLRSSVASFEPISSAASILTSPTMHTDSTDEDTDLQLPKIVAARRLQPLAKPRADGDSYFPVSGHIRQRSPLSGSSNDISQSPDGEEDVVSEEWDYTETASWGYAILLTTWIVFVVGMGSCFGVWSWAWDVGETPYAPPELEDDPTLPIVGYYPALLVLTCVMAWIWVLIAWTGMKYFRHADLKADE